MRRLITRSSLLIAVSLFSSSATAEPLPPTPTSLKIVVRNVDDEKPIASAKVEIRSAAKPGEERVGETGADGSLTFAPVSSSDWNVRVSARSFEPQERRLSLHGPSQTISFALEPAETTIVVKEERKLLRAENTGGKTTRDARFLESFPLNNQNPQQLSGLLLSVPGFVPDSANQVHPRGEHAATSILIQGFQLGGANQGRYGPILDSRVLDSLDILTGSYAPEYGSQSAAILDTTIHSGTKVPTQKFELGAGNYGTADLFASGSGQAGAEKRTGSDERAIAYYLATSFRRTENALEPPQPRNQDAHNSAEAGTLLGKLDLYPSAEDKVSLIANVAPARTQVANRTGLGDRYADVGQGYGFGGALSADDASILGIPSQAEAGQDIYQEDVNGFSVLQWKHDFSPSMTSLFSLGMNQSNLDVKNRNPHFGGELPSDASIEYDPQVKRHARHILGSGSLSAEIGEHKLKSGFSLDFQQSDEAYRLTARSQLALNALAAEDERFVPQGIILNDSQGNPVVDVNGNPVYLSNASVNAPTVDADSNGYYHAAYIQDTWKLGSALTANYGARFDIFRRSQEGDGSALEKSQLSPRLNLSYALRPKTLLRASYNHLFIDPPLSQGSTIGDAIAPARVKQVDLSLEQQIGSRQKAKVAYYYKDIRDQIDTGLLIPSTQLGIFTSVNLDRAHVQGVEFSYDLLPVEGGGSSAFLTYAYSVARPFGETNLGEPVERYNDHDQRNTLSAGTAYTFASGESIGLTQYYGTGTFSSALEEGGSRQVRTQSNLVVSSDPKLLLNRGGVKLEVQNLFDERARINFRSEFSGTRFQQGRTILLSSFFTF